MRKFREATFDVDFIVLNSCFLEGGRRRAPREGWGTTGIWPNNVCFYVLMRPLLPREGKIRWWGVIHHDLHHRGFQIVTEGVGRGGKGRHQKLCVGGGRSE